MSGSELKLEVVVATPESPESSGVIPGKHQTAIVHYQLLGKKTPSIKLGYQKPDEQLELYLR